MKTEFKLVMCRVIYQSSFKPKVLGPLKSFSWILNYKGQSELSIYLKGKTWWGVVSTAVGWEWWWVGWPSWLSGMHKVLGMGVKIIRQGSKTQPFTVCLFFCPAHCVSHHRDKAQGLAHRCWSEQLSLDRTCILLLYRPGTPKMHACDLKEEQI